jgi:hypothetical protein
MSKLAEYHTEKLLPTSEILYLIITVVTLNTSPKAGR